MKRILLFLSVLTIAVLLVPSYNASAAENASASEVVEEPVVNKPHNTKITNIKSVNGGYSNLGFGYAYRGSLNITVEGILYDSSGNPVANEYVYITMIRKINNTPVTELGKTDANGKYSIPMNIKSAVGTYEINGRKFDVIPVSASSKGINLECSEKIFYHNAF